MNRITVNPSDDEIPYDDLEQMTYEEMVKLKNYMSTSRGRYSRQGKDEKSYICQVNFEKIKQFLRDK